MDWSTYTRLARRTEHDSKGYVDALGRLFAPSTMDGSRFLIAEHLVESGMDLIRDADFLDVLKKHMFHGRPTSEQKRKGLDCYPDRDKHMRQHLSGKGVRYLHASLGMVTESAELFEAVLKGITSPQGFDPVNMAEEAGDLMWYMAILLDAMELPIEQILETNIAKLRARYKERFTKSEDQSRDLAAERSSLETGARDGHNWRMIRDEVRRLDALWRGPSIGMADDDIVDIVCKVLQRTVADKIESRTPVIPVPKQPLICNQSLREKLSQADEQHQDNGSHLKDVISTFIDNYAVIRSDVRWMDGEEAREELQSRVEEIINDLRTAIEDHPDISLKFDDKLSEPVLQAHTVVSKLEEAFNGAIHKGGFLMDDPASQASFMAENQPTSAGVRIKHRDQLAVVNDVVGAITPPARYNHPGKREAIDLIRDALGDELFAGFCAGQIIKYRYRQGAKPGDAEKAKWYGDMLNHLSGAGPDPRSARPDFQSYECPGAGSGNKYLHKLRTLKEYALGFGQNCRLIHGEST